MSFMQIFNVLLDELLFFFKDTQEVHNSDEATIAVK